MFHRISFTYSRLMINQFLGIPNFFQKKNPSNRKHLVLLKLFSVEQQTQELRIILTSFLIIFLSITDATQQRWCTEQLHTVILLLPWFLCYASAGIFLSSHSPDSPFVIYNFTIIAFTTSLFFLKATNLPALEVLQKPYLWTCLVAHLPSSLLFYLRLLHFYCLQCLLL